MKTDDLENPSVPLGPDDEEVLRRNADLESGAVKAISHEELLVRAGFVNPDRPRTS
jgi:hypothetical protein